MIAFFKAFCIPTFNEFLGKLMLDRRQVRFSLLASAILTLTFSSSPVLGCKCVSPPPEVKTARDLAQWYANRSDAIFEGSVEQIELKWPVLEAKVGDLISADIEQDPPAMQVSFDISRSYRGPRQQNIRIRTGLGGGDCGFRFEVGERYLVYAYADESGQLSTNICTGTARLEESQADLSYMRGEPVVSETVEGTRPFATEKLCGRAVRTGFDFTNGQIFLLRVGNESPIPSDKAELAADGSFCFNNVLVGKYRLLFINRAGDSPAFFVYFPGVVTSSAATVIEVKGDHPISELVFDVPTQSAFSVSGTVRASNKLELPAECKVILLSAEPFSFLLAYSQDVGPSGYFEFPNVLPGKYWALVTVDSDGTSSWLTRKAEVDVSADVAEESLELIAR